MRILGLIPARGGSKGVPRKNLTEVAGRPLVAYTIELARQAKHLDRVVVSTDDDEIAEVSRAYGAEVPFLRPVDVATDQAPMLAVVQHALERLRADGDVFDAVCLLQPTSPLRPSGLIDDCIERFTAAGATSVVTVREVPHTYNPGWVMTLDPSGHGQWPGGASDPAARRQDLVPAYYRDGLVYLVTAEAARGGSLYGDALVPLRTFDLPDCNVDTAGDVDRLRGLVTTDAWTAIGHRQQWWSP